MDLSELLEAIRQNYIDQLAVALHEAKSEPGAQLVSEAVLRDEQGTAVREGRLQLPMRVDGVIVQEGEGVDSISVDSTSCVSGFADISFEWPGGLHVSLNPFFWDALRIHLPEGNPNMDWEPLRNWYEDWFRAEEDGAGDLLLVVHFLSDPEEAEQGLLLQADMGSAPVLALEELFDAFAGMDVSRVVLGTPPQE